MKHGQPHVTVPLGAFLQCAPETAVLAEMFGHNVDSLAPGCACLQLLALYWLLRLHQICISSKHACSTSRQQPGILKLSLTSTAQADNQHKAANTYEYTCAFFFFSSRFLVPPIQTHKNFTDNVQTS